MVSISWDIVAAKGIHAVTAILGVSCWLWAMGHCLKNPRLTDRQRQLWLVMMLLTSLFGVLLYYSFGRLGNACQDDKQAQHTKNKV